MTAVLILVKGGEKMKRLHAGSQLPPLVDESKVLVWIQNYTTEDYVNMDMITPNYDSNVNMTDNVTLTMPFEHMQINGNDSTIYSITKDDIILPAEFGMPIEQFRHFCLFFQLGSVEQCIDQFVLLQDVKFIVKRFSPLVVMPFFTRINYGQVSWEDSLQKLVYYQHQAIILNVFSYPIVISAEQKRALNKAMLDQFLYVYEEKQTNFKKRKFDDNEEDSWEEEEDDHNKQYKLDHDPSPPLSDSLQAISSFVKM